MNFKQIKTCTFTHVFQKSVCVQIYYWFYVNFKQIKTCTFTHVFQKSVCVQIYYWFYVNFKWTFSEICASSQKQRNLNEF